MNNRELLRNIPAVDRLLENDTIKELRQLTSDDVVKYAIRQTLGAVRASCIETGVVMPLEDIISEIERVVFAISNKSLKRVINGSGIILHTNLGRAPLGRSLIDDVKVVLEGYSNLEFDLEKGQRGDRDSHTTSIISYLTGAEDVVVVNNNAAAVMFLLTVFGKGKESIVSRGELIEIGGSFRIPDIMKVSGSKMIEVGATNKTKVSDYENIIGAKSAILFKAHRSNFTIKGFTEEVSIKELADLGHKHNLISIYDIGSGLLRKVDSVALKDEPDVREAIDAGIDLVCFSGDKLLGGGQAGIIAGKKIYIEKLKKHPLLRALRVCKTTIAILESACRYYLDDEKLFRNNILFATLNRGCEELERSGIILKQELERLGIDSSVIASFGQYGGGTLPDLTIPSYEVKLHLERYGKGRKGVGKLVFDKLLLSDTPILTNLKSGEIYIDMLCVDEGSICDIASIIKKVTDRL